MQFLAARAMAIGLQDPQGFFEEPDTPLTMRGVGAQLLVLALQQCAARRAIHGIGERTGVAFQHAAIVACLDQRCTNKSLCL